MRLVTPARLRAVGYLLLEATTLGLLLASRYGKDPEVRGAIRSFVRRARAL